MQTNELSIVKPHRKVSRTVTQNDIERVEREAKAMRAWMLKRADCVGLAHPQVDDTDPLAFFVTLEGANRVILNPRVVHFSNKIIQSKEGCMTYPGHEHIYHDRHFSIVAEYEIIKANRLVRKRKFIDGFLAVVWQHEIDHLNGVYCYDNPNEKVEHLCDYGAGVNGDLCRICKESCI